MPKHGKIDVHFHTIPGFFKDAVYAAGSGPSMGRYPDWSPALSLETMDAHGIDVAITSVVAPGVQFAEANQARSLARQCNDYSAELVRRAPTRFGAFALLPLQDIDLAIAEAQYSLDQLRFEGVFLFASYGEKYLGDPLFDPLLEYLNDRQAVVFVHPAYHPSSRRLDLPWPGFLMEYVFDTTRAAVNLLFSGALARYTSIKFILSHAGGTLPYIAWRLAAAPRMAARIPQLSPADIRLGLASYWYDTALSPAPQTLAALADVASAGKILFGSDWPMAPSNVVADEVKALNSPGALSAAQRRSIEHENALVLFPGRASAKTRSDSSLTAPGIRRDSNN